MARSVKIKDSDSLDIDKNVSDTEDTVKFSGDFDDYIQAVFSEIGGDVNEQNIVLKVYRVVENKAEVAYLFACTPAELPILDKLRDEYSGGRFEVRVYRNNGCIRRKVVVIEAAKKPVVVKTEDTSQLAKIMLDGFNRIADKMATMNTQPQVMPDPSKLMETMGNMIMNFQRMMPQAPTIVNPVEQSLALVQKGIELAQGINRDGQEPSMVGVLSDFFKSPLLEHMLRPKVEPIMQTQSRPVGNQQPINQADAVRKQYINMLLQKAKQGASPELYAEYILDNAPEDVVRENFIGPTVINDIMRLVPEVGNHVNWFTELQKAIMQMLDDTDLPADDTELDIPADEHANTDTLV
jgi:hypothetical protein